MAVILFLKARVAGHVRADGVVVRPYERRGPDSFNARYGRVVAAAKKAQDSLPFDARHQLERWQYASWDLNPLQAAFRGDPANADLRRTVDAAMAPVRQVIAKEFGATVPLWRGETHYKPNDRRSKGVFSWTMDPARARLAAGGAPVKKVLTDEQIEGIGAVFDSKGYVRVGRRQFLRSRTDPQYFDIYDDRQMITDGDNLREMLRDERNDAVESNTRRRQAGTIYHELIPVSEVAWVFPDAKEREFLVTRGPRAS